MQVAPAVLCFALPGGGCGVWCERVSRAELQSLGLRSARLAAACVAASQAQGLRASGAENFGDWDEAAPELLRVGSFL